MSPRPFRTVLFALLAVAFAGPALAAPLPDLLSTERHFTPFQLVAADCFDIGERIASRMGARLVRADRVGDQCRLVLLVQGEPGERPRRQTMTVPLR